MIGKKTIAAVIPVRAGSRRLPNKNILPFGDSNLLVHKIRQLKQVAEIDTIIVSSDSDEMLDMARAESRGGGSCCNAPKILTQKRPLEYCDEKTKTFNEVIEYVASFVKEDILIWAPCVCPLTTPQNYQNAIFNFYKYVIEKKEYDSVISAKLFKEYLFGENGPLNYIPDKHVPSQQLPDWKVVVNGFYIAFKNDMIKWRYFYNKKPYLHVLNKKEAVDIDDVQDFEVAKALLGVE